MSEEFLTAAETASILSVSIRTIQRYCKQGRLNYKWVTGKRHKELRIIPPIPVSDLPGVKRQKGMSSIDYVTRTDFENTTEEMKLHLREKDSRIGELENEIAQLKSLITQNSGTVIRTGGSGLSGDELREKAEALVKDFNKVRPVEKKLILKLARDIQAHDRFLRSLGMTSTESDEPLVE